MKTAIVLGSTGLTGGLLLQELLQDTRYGKIILFSRNKIAVKHKKIEEHLVNLFELEDYQERFKADEVFVCIGTTKHKTPDEQTYHKIDKGIPVTAAKLAKQNGIATFLVISAMGASADSSMFYNKIKGEMEQEVLEQGIPRTYIFRPSLIAGNREEKRSWENLAIQVMKVLNYVLIGPLKKYRSVHPGAIAKAMVTVANKGYKSNIILSDEIVAIAKAPL